MKQAHCKNKRCACSGRSAPLATGALALAAGLLTADLYTSPTPAFAGPAAAVTATPSESLPDSLNLNAIIRDFAAKGTPNGHADFEAYGNSYITTGLVNDTLDSDHKPVFKTKRGQEISVEYKDSSGRIINPAHYDASRGDTKGTLRAVASDQLTSASAFGQWYRDVQNVNLSKMVPLKLTRVPNTNRYVFDSATDEPYKTRGGFFPINAELMGNQGTTGKNFAFTTEIDTVFVFDRSKDYVFTFTGDDDVWVYINDKLVLDLGGLHSKKVQSVQLNRLAWLEDGKKCSLRVFHAERHTNESNFRIETTLQLLPADLPPSTGLYD